MKGSNGNALLSPQEIALVMHVCWHSWYRISELARSAALSWMPGRAAIATQRCVGVICHHLLQLRGYTAEKLDAVRRRWRPAMRCSDIHKPTVPRGIVGNSALENCRHADMISPLRDILVNVLALSAFFQDVLDGALAIFMRGELAVDA